MTLKESLENIAIRGLTGGITHKVKESVSKPVVPPPPKYKPDVYRILRHRIEEHIRRGIIQAPEGPLGQPYRQYYWHALEQDERDLLAMRKQLTDKKAVDKHLDMVRKLKNKIVMGPVEGQGDYFIPRFSKKLTGRVMDSVGALGGGMVGGMYGGPLGAAVGAGLGGGAGSELARITGMGDYSVRNNSLYRKGEAIQPGQVIPSFGVGNNVTRIRHREFIQDYLTPSTPSAFSNTTFTINPGNVICFPWLSAVAANYQQYKFNGLLFEFRTMTSEVTAGGAMGTVIMATNYDVNDSAFADKLHMENSQYAISAKPSSSILHTVECAPNLTATKLLYVRNASSSTTATSDNRFFDLGLFQMASTGLSATAGTALGELWVTYDVSLFKPEVATTSAAAGQTLVGSGSVSKASVFGTAATSVGAAIASGSGSTLTFNIPGQYLVNFIVTAGTTLINAGAVGGTATTKSNLWDSVTSAATTMTSLYRVNVTSAGQTLVLDYSGANTVTATNTRISSWNYANG